MFRKSIFREPAHAHLLLQLARRWWYDGRRATHRAAAVLCDVFGDDAKPDGRAVAGADIYAVAGADIYAITYKFGICAVAGADAGAVGRNTERMAGIFDQRVSNTTHMFAALGGQSLDATTARRLPGLTRGSQRELSSVSFSCSASRSQSSGPCAVACR